MGLYGCRTATTRDSGNLSSRCRYKTGARLRASMAPLSAGFSAPCTSMGRSGMWARGPHPTDMTTATDNAPRRIAPLKLCRSTAIRTVGTVVPKVGRSGGHSEGRCESRVQLRTIPRKSFISSTAIGTEFRSAVHAAPVPSSETPRSIPQRRCLTSLCDAEDVAELPSTSQVLRVQPEKLPGPGHLPKHLHKTCPLTGQHTAASR